MKHLTRGQGMVEFALTLPILTLVIFGLIDFGRVLFTYAQASNALRNAVRYAEVIGYQDTPTKVYLDCAGMKKAAGEVFFAKQQSIDIKYINAKSTASPRTSYDCTTVKDELLENGDILEINVRAKVQLIAFPIAEIPFNFTGRRTIVKKIDIGAECMDLSDEDLCDRDFDGLADGWERVYFGSMTEYNATDDPDGDGCNNGCEEMKGTNPKVHNGTGAPGDTTGIPVPPAPTNFAATWSCDTGLVSFSWDPMSPIPARGEIRNERTGLIAVLLDNESPGLITQAYCTDCDRINTTNGVKTYYMFAVNGTPPNEVQGPNSNKVNVWCVKVPPAPVNFYAEPDCTTGKVDFSWEWGSTDPYPTRAEIRNASTNAVIYSLTDMSATTCDDCDTIPIPTGSRSYYIVAYNGVTGIEEKVSPNSNTAGATCPRPNSAKVTGKLWQDSGNPRNREMDSGEDGFKNVTVTLYRTDGTAGPWTFSTDNDGIYTFSSLKSGDYKIVVPVDLAQNGNWILDVVRGDYSDFMISNELHFRISDGQTITFNFGYMKN